MSEITAQAPRSEQQVKPKLEIKAPPVLKGYAPVYISTAPHARVFDSKPTRDNPHPVEHDLHGSLTIQYVVHEDIAGRIEKEGRSFLYETKTGFAGTIVKVTRPEDIEHLGNVYFVPKGAIGHEKSKKDSNKKPLEEPEFDPEEGIPF